MCTVSGLIAGVARARLPYAENPVSGDLLGTREDVCARAVSACGVRKCVVGSRRESGQQHRCGEAVPGAADGRRPLGNAPDNTYSQGSQELSASVGTRCRPGSLANAQGLVVACHPPHASLRPSLICPLH